MNSELKIDYDNVQIIENVPNLLTVDDADAMSMTDSLRLFEKHINPNLGKIYKLLGLSSRRPIRAKGSWIYMEDGTKVLDFTSGLAVLALGHNHPKIMEARKRWAAEDQLEIWKFIPSPYQAVLAHNLSKIMPGDLEKVFFCNSGAEANEGALKMAMKYAGRDRDITAFTNISFHGKTLATLSVSGSEKSGCDAFRRLPGCVEVPYGDIDAFERLLSDNRNEDGQTRVGCFIVEAIRSEGVISPPIGYLKRVRELCTKHDVVLICDEVFCGFGRTGKMFAFEHEDIVPDIVTCSKAFGAGKATFAAIVARSPIFMGAYGTLDEATLHSTTFSGFGEEIVTAITGLEVIYEERLVDRSRELGDYLLDQMNGLAQEHKNLVSDVSGRGLMVSIQLTNGVSRFLSKNGLINSKDLEAKVSKLLTGSIISRLYQKHGILTLTPLHDPTQILLVPPLNIKKSEIDIFITAFDECLNCMKTSNIVRMARNAL
ncbi:MAG: aspartate aminotransferase family protein [Pseudomonadota bacterium]